MAGALGGVQDDEAEVYEQFIGAGNLMNCLKLAQQLEVLTYNRKIFLDITCNSEYWFDEFYFDLPRKYGHDLIWNDVENKLDITIIKKKLSRSIVPHRHRRYNKIWFIWNGTLPILMCDMLHIIQTLNLKAQYNHRFLERITVSRKYGDYDQIELF